MVKLKAITNPLLARAAYWLAEALIHDLKHSMMQASALTADNNTVVHQVLAKRTARLELHGTAGAPPRLVLTQGRDPRWAAKDVTVLGEARSTRCWKRVGVPSNKVRVNVLLRLENLAAQPAPPLPLCHRLLCALEKQQMVVLVVKHAVRRELRSKLAHSGQQTVGDDLACLSRGLAVARSRKFESRHYDSKGVHNTPPPEIDT
jgi:hypothetical protein